VVSPDLPALCWLHEDDDEHWVAEADIVGLIPLVDGDLRRDMPLAQAARSCAEALGRPDRVVEWGAGR
jgi:hypothetical protein